MSNLFPGKISVVCHQLRSVLVAALLAIRTLEHEVPGSNPSVGGIQLMTIMLYRTVFHYHPSIVSIRDMTSKMLKGM